jgi:hypothetical protein
MIASRLVSNATRREPHTGLPSVGQYQAPHAKRRVDITQAKRARRAREQRDPARAPPPRSAYGRVSDNMAEGVSAKKMS